MCERFSSPLASRCHSYPSEHSRFYRMRTESEMEVGRYIWMGDEGKRLAKICQELRASPAPRCAGSALVYL